jgi:hypothetical protein
MKKGDISVLSQLVKTLEEMGLKLEKAYNKKDFEKFNNLKKLMLKIQKQIAKMLK